MESLTPLTPPAECTQYKRSVSFDLPEQEKDQTLPMPSPCVSINAVGLPNDILVALSDRHTEMKSMSCYPQNRELFESIRNRITTRWPRFERILYTPRSSMSDREWMSCIQDTLKAPDLAGRFKDLVGYAGDDEGHDQRQPDDWFAGVTLSRIRDFPERTASLQDSYPQFFVNCKEELEDVAEFKNALFASRDQITDKEWEDAIYHQLDKKPILFKQLQEIIAYESGYDP